MGGKKGVQERGKVTHRKGKKYEKEKKKNSERRCYHGGQGN